ncbi:methyltransferase [Pseudorhodoferax soli]|uniref:Uncharacterized protein n=1 Tax=Pseudorhodoferax soli TaxID=545864 RepID=A0A368XB63_9BURK|nr:methyltransferase [Pseudorhodoferax soli]RCW65095.1 hypothetical protein DES41_11319 [Pseudorhodoferax soli]
MSAAILSNAVGRYLMAAISDGHVKTLPQLAFTGELREGAPFIYYGHVYGKGFGVANKTPALSLSEKLDAPLEGKRLLVEFSKGGLANSTAYVRLSGSTRLFVFGYITGIDQDVLRAVPYVIGDLVTTGTGLELPFLSSLELRPEDVDQFASMDNQWIPSESEFKRMAGIPESAVKGLICKLLGEHSVPKDWGGEESDVMSANLMLDGRRHTAAFLLKGPSRFHPMKPTDLGKNGDQLYRLFNIPAHVYVVQHCHQIGAPVRKQTEAFALQRSFQSPCRMMFMDGLTTARLLRANGEWPGEVEVARRATPRRRSLRGS